MDTVQFYIRVQELLDERGWNDNKFVKESGLPKSTWYNMKKRQSEPKLMTMSKIIKGLDVSEQEFFHPELTGTIYTADDAAFIEKKHKLDIAQRARLAAYMDGMIEEIESRKE